MAGKQKEPSVNRYHPPKIATFLFITVIFACSAVSAPGQEILPNNNTRVGDQALISLTTGFDNTAFGYYALKDNSSANDNTGVGAFALQHNTTGTENTAIGRAALTDNVSGNHNTAVG